MRRVRLLPLLALAAGCGDDTLTVRGFLLPGSDATDVYVVGQPLPPTVELRTVPNHTEYRYAVVNDRRVIVEPRTRKMGKSRSTAPNGMNQKLLNTAP